MIDRRLLNLFGQQAAIALENARLVSALSRALAQAELARGDDEAAAQVHRPVQLRGRALPAEPGGAAQSGVPDWSCTGSSLQLPIDSFHFLRYPSRHSMPFAH